MRIVRFDVVVLELEFLQPFETSFARMDRKETVLVRAHDDTGAIGYGEAPVFQLPSYNADYVAETVYGLEHFLLPALVDADLAAGSVVGQLAAFRGHRPAKGAIEAALWHLTAQQQAVPVYRLWGGGWEAVTVGISLGIESDMARLLASVEQAVTSGYRRIKLKITPGWDVEPVRAVRSRFPDASLSVDANGAYDSAKAPVWHGLDGLGLTMIEQPFPGEALVEHARLQAKVATPISLDESITSVDAVQTAVEIGAARVFCVKPSSVGGYGAARCIAGWCQEQGLDAWVGGMFETGIGKAFAVHLAASPGFTMPGDISDTRRYFKQDVLAAPIAVQDGFIELPAGPGLGWEIDEDAVATLTVSSRTVSGRNRR